MTGDAIGPAPSAAVIEATQRWIDTAVIGLGLCPFAGAVRRAGTIRFVCSEAVDEAGLLGDLGAELLRLAAVPAAQTETTLLIHPRVLADFRDYNDFLDSADACIDRLALRGEIQIASFHPDYRFAGCAASAIENFSNRSPYPMLHLLREAGVDAAVQKLDDPAEIYRRNIATLRALGHTGWRRLWKP